MATKQHTSIPYAALAAIIAALAIGFVPVAALVALNAQMETVR
jgi:hypothetical protein